MSVDSADAIVNNEVRNRNSPGGGSDSGWVWVPGYGRMLWEDLDAYIKAGKIKASTQIVDGKEKTAFLPVSGTKR